MDEKPDEKDIHQWLTVDQFPEHLKKYWHQRYRIWSQYDKGIWMTEDAWFGVTPEPVANSIAAHMAESTPANKKILIDAFAGVGGNSIAFARTDRWSQIYAMEKDPKAVKCAKHNAKLYGVDKKIMFVTTDCFLALQKRFNARDDVVVFGSPPWGGTEYGAEEVFDLSKMQPYNLKFLYNNFRKHSSSIVLYLPRTSDLNQIARYAPEAKKLEVAHYAMLGASKALCVYFGDFEFDDEETGEQQQEESCP